MTEIPIEKKGGIAWWIWLIIAAIVIALLIWLFAGRDQRNDAVQTTAPTALPAAADNAPGPGALAANHANDAAASATRGAPITDLATLLNGPANAVVGRQVRLTNVPAGVVPADAGFWITGEGDKGEYVILHEVRTLNTPIEGRIDVNKGDHLDIVGTVRSAAKAFRRTRRSRDRRRRCRPGWSITSTRDR